MRGDKSFAELGVMSPCIKALAKSQDIIGYCNFMEGYILTHFYATQSFQLAMSSSYLNGTDWARQFISKLLHVTHSQWIFCNISLHNKINGYLHKIEVRGDNARTRAPGRDSSGRHTSRKLILIGDQIQQIL
jgi:hypothetical protein